MSYHIALRELIEQARTEYSRYRLGITNNKDLVLKVLEDIQDTCPHNQGRGEPSYWNDGSRYCKLCGNDEQGYWNENLNDHS